MTTGYTLTGVFGQDEGANIGFGSILNFAGAGVTATAVGSLITVTIPGGGGSSYVLVTTSATPYVMAAATTTVLAAPVGAQTVQLPAANGAGVTAGSPYTVKRVNTTVNVVTVTSAGGTIDGVAAATGIALAGGTFDSITVQSDGTNWWIV
jgi:hypothetical protein